MSNNFVTRLETSSHEYFGSIELQCCVCEVVSEVVSVQAPVDE